MMRLISIILLLAGAAAAGFGGWMMYTGQGVKAELGQADDSVPAQTSPVPAPVAAMPEAVEAEREDAPSLTRSLGDKGDDDLTDSVKVASAPGLPVTAPALDDEPVFGTASDNTASVLENLQRVPIAHETPETAQFGKAFEVTVAIDATGDASAVDALPGSGRITEGEARVSHSVKALVTGTNFQIEPLSPEEQELSPLTENVWRWKVTPMETGSQDLTIELYALIGDKALPVRTYRNSVVVEISRLRQAVIMARDANPLTMLLGGIGSVLAGLFGAARFFKGS